MLLAGRWLVTTQMWRGDKSAVLTHLCACAASLRFTGRGHFWVGTINVTVIQGVKIYLANYLWTNWRSNVLRFTSIGAPTFCALLWRRERDLYIELCLW